MNDLEKFKQFLETKKDYNRRMWSIFKNFQDLGRFTNYPNVEKGTATIIEYDLGDGDLTVELCEFCRYENYIETVYISQKYITKDEKVVDRYFKILKERKLRKDKESQLEQEKLKAKRRKEIEKTERELFEKLKKKYG